MQITPQINPVTISVWFATEGKLFLGSTVTRFNYICA